MPASQCIPPRRPTFRSTTEAVFVSHTHVQSRACTWVWPWQEKVLGCRGEDGHERDCDGHEK
eukprot:scaffold524_cov357-Pavlova_lutheri.AAC.6